VSLEFLTVGAEPPIARSPMERAARAAGARFEIRAGWNVAVGYGSSPPEAPSGGAPVRWADTSHLGKLELQAPPEAMAAIVAAVVGETELALGRATRAAGAWWLPLTPSRTLVVGGGGSGGGSGGDGADESADAGVPSALRQRLRRAAAESGRHASIADVTTALAALTVIGPVAREMFARFCAIDLRPAVTPVGGLRPGSVARQPGLIVREDEERFLCLFGWAVAEYMWTVVDDAGRRLGGSPVGLDALPKLTPPLHEVRDGA
jgi:glycine cleavage system aminomethyltransferase T